MVEHLSNATHWHAIHAWWRKTSMAPKRPDTPIFNLFSLIAPQPSDLAKSSINTNSKSTTRFAMGLTWTSYTLPLNPHAKGAQKRKTAVFHVKSHFDWRKSATKWGDDGKSKCVVAYDNSLTSVRRLAVTKRPCDCSCLIFARSASVVTISANSSILIRIGSPLPAFQCIRWTVYVAPKPPINQSRCRTRVTSVGDPINEPLICRPVLCHPD